ncbi:MAG: sensor histidine kinase [Bacteroidota bacterium]
MSELSFFSSLTPSRLLRSKLVQHLLFWLISFAGLLRFFTKDYGLSLADVIYTLLFHISLIVVVEAHIQVLIERYLRLRKYTAYFFGVLLLLLLGVQLNIWTFRHLSDWLFPGYYFISYYNWWQILQFMLLYLVVSTLLEFSKSWFQQLEMRERMQAMEKQQIETELRVLRAQINPHFLFNSLNHIYALALKNHRYTSNAIIQLAQLLRYGLQHHQERFVPLKQELDYIARYVEFYKQRLSHPERIDFTINGMPSQLEIAPMLLIIFIENCFKHGQVSNKGDQILIDITVDPDEGSLRLITNNDIKARTSKPSAGDGLGLDNARKRLRILYPNQHILNIRQTEKTFTVDLEIQLDQSKG